MNAATLLICQRRWGNVYLAQLSRRDLYDPSTPPYDTIDEDVLQQALDAAGRQVRQKIGTVSETHWAVVELLPYFLNCPQEEFGFERMKYVLDSLKMTPVAARTTTLAKGDDNDRRRLDGDDLKDLLDLQKRTRGRRSSF